MFSLFGAVRTSINSGVDVKKVGCGYGRSDKEKYKNEATQILVKQHHYFTKKGSDIIRLMNPCIVFIEF